MGDHYRTDWKSVKDRPHVEVDGGGKKITRSRKSSDPSELSDEELLSLIVEKYKEALGKLYERYSTQVYSLALHILRDPGLAEEAAQDTFFNVWRRAMSFRSSRGTVAAWLFSILHHRAIDEIRRRKRRDDHRSDKDPMTLDTPADNTTDPVRYTSAQFDRAFVKDALKVLRPEQREIVELAYYGGLTHTEISERLNQPLGTVKTRMRLALRKLRETIEPGALG